MTSTDNNIANREVLHMEGKLGDEISRDRRPDKNRKERNPERNGDVRAHGVNEQHAG